VCQNILDLGAGHDALREAGNSPIKIEHWAGTGFSWDFDQGGAQPKGPAGKIPGRPLPERIRGVSLGGPECQDNPEGTATRCAGGCVFGSGRKGLGERERFSFVARSERPVKR